MSGRPRNPRPSPERQFALDLDWLGSTAQGRRVLHRLIVGTGCLASPSTDPFALGRESVGHEYLGFLASHRAACLASLLEENRPEAPERARDDDDGAGADRDPGGDERDTD